LRTLSLTTLTLLAFAANSILCRLALGDAVIDAASFTALRLASGAAALWLITVAKTRQGRPAAAGSLRRACMLFLYAAAFSYAYVELGAGVGALILFAAVQGTMILAGVRHGERLTQREGVGLLSASAGLIYLLLPGLSAPSLTGTLLMAVAGGAWGVYSLQGRRVLDPLSNTTGNFLLAAPMAILAIFIMPDPIHLTSRGVWLATICGALTSGVGYVLWYAALRWLTAVRAAIVQLAVPAFAALGGVFFLDEPLTSRLLVAGSLILSGIAFASTGRQR